MQGLPRAGRVRFRMVFQPLFQLTRQRLLLIGGHLTAKFGQSLFKFLPATRVDCRGEIQTRFRTNRRGKRGRHRIVVAGRNRIELVVMTSRTSDRQPQERNARGHHHVVQLVITCRFELCFG